MPSSKWLVFEAVKLVLCGGSHKHGAKFGDFHWWWPNPGCSDAVCHQTGILRDGLCFRWCSSDDVARFGKTPVTVQKQQQSTLVCFGPNPLQPAVSSVLTCPARRHPLRSQDLVRVPEPYQTSRTVSAKWPEPAVSVDKYLEMPR